LRASVERLDRRVLNLVASAGGALDDDTIGQMTVALLSRSRAHGAAFAALLAVRRARGGESTAQRLALLSQAAALYSLADRTRAAAPLRAAELEDQAAALRRRALLQPVDGRELEQGLIAYRAVLIQSLYLAARLGERRSSPARQTVLADLIAQLWSSALSVEQEVRPALRALPRAALEAARDPARPPLHLAGWDPPE
jgi:hypothetical protein